MEFTPVMQRFLNICKSITLVGNINRMDNISKIMHNKYFTRCNTKVCVKALNKMEIGKLNLCVLKSINHINKASAISLQKLIIGSFSLNIKTMEMIFMLINIIQHNNECLS